MFLSFQARRSSATRSSTSDLTVVLRIADNFKESASTSDVDIDRGDQFFWNSQEYIFKGEVLENEFHICVRVCGVEGRGKRLSGQFFFVCEKDDRDSGTRNRARSHSGA